MKKWILALLAAVGLTFAQQYPAVFYLRGRSIVPIRANLDLGTAAVPLDTVFCAYCTGGGGGGGYDPDSLVWVRAFGDSLFITYIDADEIETVDLEASLGAIDTVTSNAVVTDTLVAMGSWIDNLEIGTLLTVSSFDLDDTLFINQLGADDFLPINIEHMAGQYQIFGWPDSVSWLIYSSTREFDTGSRKVDMAVDGNGTVHIVVESGSDVLYSTRTAAGVWSGWETVATGYSTNCPVIAIDSNNIPIVAYSSGASTSAIVYKSGGSWIADTTLTCQSNNHDIATYGTNVYWVGYHGASDLTLRSQASRGGDWVGDVIDAGAPTSPRDSRIAVRQANGRVIVVNTGSYYDKSTGSWVKQAAYAAASFSMGNTASCLSVDEITGNVAIALSQATSFDPNICIYNGAAFSIYELTTDNYYGNATWYGRDGTHYYSGINAGSSYEIQPWYWNGANWVTMDSPVSAAYSGGASSSAAICSPDSTFTIVWLENLATDYLRLGHYDTPPGPTTGFSGATVRINGAINGDAEAILVDPGGYDNTNATAGDIWLGNPVGLNDNSRVFGHFFLPQVNDAGPMTATNGTEGEVVYNLADNKAYVCTVTGTPATWAALN